MSPERSESPGSGWRWSRPLRVHLSFIIVLLLLALSVPLMWITFQEGRQAALASAEQQMRLLSRNTVDLFSSAFRDGYSTITVGAVLPSLAADPAFHMDAKREFFVRTLKGSPHLDAVYVGYPDGAFVHIIRVARSERWRDAVGAPAEAMFGLRVVTRSTDERAVSTWYFLDGDGRQLGAGPAREVDFDPRRRPWYRAAVGKGDPISYGPYTSASTDALTLTLAGTMTTDGRIVIGVDIMLETIAEMLVEHAVSANSIGYVFDRDGKLIVHSDPVVMAELVDQLSNTSAGNRAFASNDAELVAQVVARGGVVEESAVENDHVLTAVEGLLKGIFDEAGGDLFEFQVGKSAWLGHVGSVNVGGSDLLGGYKVVIAAPVNDFTAASVELLKQKLMVAGLFVIFGVLLALFISRRISRALFSLAQDANQIGNLDFHGWQVPSSHISEINMLGRAISSARDAIHTFAIYVPRELVRQIVASNMTAGAGQRREVTVLFTDIRDFTTISEQRSPEEVVEMLGEYFETMNVIVERHSGVIVQYLGDSIYAMWNAPTENPDHVVDACRCALELKAAIDALNEKSRRSGRAELVTRFGLHTGIAVVGSVGAEERKQYTAMGDTVNVASRLEGMNKQFGTTILASAAVKDRAGATVCFRPLGAATAKGRHEQIEVFELLQAHSEA
ncbi:MAG: adenylate/guanylate cyclase domain-containing protein [Rhizobiaceae bacterium]|nr:adenylate/guanylate cyclase domain-containing protein [Rhizobiaceae bacterium]